MAGPERSTRHPTPGRMRRSTVPQTAVEYLEKKRGAEMATFILEAARFFAEYDDKEPERLRAAERRRAAKAALVLLPLVQRDVPTLAGIIEQLVKRYSKPAVARSGRRKGKRAWLVSMMLYWGAGELAVRGQEQLTVMELIAIAAAIGFEGVEWSNRSAELDTWRHLRREYLPANPSKLEEEARQRMLEREKERVLREAAAEREVRRQALRELQRFGLPKPRSEAEKITPKTGGFVPVE